MADKDNIEERGNEHAGLIWDQRTGRFLIPSPGWEKGENTSGTNANRTTGPMGLAHKRNPAFTIEGEELEAVVDQVIDAVLEGKDVNDIIQSYITPEVAGEDSEDD